jgi:hypothetical protein
MPIRAPRVLDTLIVTTLSSATDSQVNIAPATKSLTNQS